MMNLPLGNLHDFRPFIIQRLNHDYQFKKSSARVFLEKQQKGKTRDKTHIWNSYPQGQEQQSTFIHGCSLMKLTICSILSYARGNSKAGEKVRQGLA